MAWYYGLTLDVHVSVHPSIRHRSVFHFRMVTSVNINGFWPNVCALILWRSGQGKLRGMFEMNCLFLSGDFTFQVSQKYSFHALEVLPLARNAKFQPMYPLLESVTVRWFGHSNKVLMNGRSKCLSGLVFPPSKECFQFRKQKEITWGKVWGIRGLRQNSYFFFLQKRRNCCGDMSWDIAM